MIEQHEVDADAVVARNFERRIHIAEELRVDAEGQVPVVVDDSRPAVAEQEPTDDDEAEARDGCEVASDRFAPGDDAEMRSPDARAEIEPVEDRAAVSRPRIVDPVNECVGS
jgi:hypothetical protein